MPHQTASQSQTVASIPEAWVKEVVAMMGVRADEARQIIVAVLKGLCTQLSPAQGIELAEQLPVCVRDGLVEVTESRPNSVVRDLTSHVAETCPMLRRAQTERALWAVFTMLSHHLSPQLLRDVRDSLPVNLRKMWNTAA